MDAKFLADQKAWRALRQAPVMYPMALGVPDEVQLHDALVKQLQHLIEEYGLLDRMIAMSSKLVYAATEEEAAIDLAEVLSWLGWAVEVNIQPAEQWSREGLLNLDLEGLVNVLETDLQEQGIRVGPVDDL